MSESSSTSKKLRLTVNIVEQPRLHNVDFIVVAYAKDSFGNNVYLNDVVMSAPQLKAWLGHLRLDPGEMGL